jgi:glycerol-3-phosphate dehydrogenase
LEWTAHLDDMMVRRTSWRYYHRDHDATAERVAVWMAESLGWDEVETSTELARYRTLVSAAAR